jgi:ceramide glucosyltransferase
MLIIPYYILAALLIYYSFKSLRGGVAYLNYFRQELARPLPDYTPFATIFAPCRGIDQGMLENLDALLSQDYPEFEIVFIVDEETDAATGVIESAWKEGRRQVKLVVAPKATDSSQKVTNLREAIQYAEPTSEIFVFADSDARPTKSWLRNLVAPIADESVAVTTGYRWFISNRSTFASELRNMWNASIASSLGPNQNSNFCWGGATAVRRELFERLQIVERWRGTVSDDFMILRVLKEAGLTIYFVPAALTPSIENCSLRELIEFTTRQMKLTRVYAQNLWLMSFLGAGLFLVVVISSLLIVTLSARNNVAVLVAIATLVVVTFSSVGKSWFRLKAVRLALPQYEPELRKQIFPQLTLWSVTPALFFFNCFAALISRRLTWRGTTYEMISSQETRVLESGR